MAPPLTTTGSRSTAPGITVERRDSLAAAQEIAHEWRALLRRAAGATPFQSPDWTLPWYEVFAPDGVLVLAARNGAGELIGLVPVVRQPGRLELAGGGVSDYLAPVIDDDAAAEVCAALDADLASLGLDCRFDDVPPQSPWVEFAREQPGWTASPACVCPVVPLAGDRPWLDRLEKGLRRNLRRYGERLTEEGEVRYTTVHGVETLALALAALFRLHTKRWHERHEAGVLADADVRRFHELSAPALVDDGLLQLHVLRVGEPIVAVQYVLVLGDDAFSYIGGFDPAWSRFGPGTLMMAFAIQRAAAAGCREFDLLRGAEPYKYRWGAVNRTSVGLTRRMTAHRA